MTKQELKLLLVDSLHISVTVNTERDYYDDNQVIVEVYFDDELISKSSDSIPLL